MTSDEGTMAQVWHITYDGPLPPSALVGEILAEATDLEQRHGGLRQGTAHVAPTHTRADRLVLRVAFRSAAGEFLVTRSAVVSDDDRHRQLVRDAFAAAARLLGDHRERASVARAA